MIAKRGGKNKPRQLWFAGVFDGLGVVGPTIVRYLKHHDHYRDSSGQYGCVGPGYEFGSFGVIFSSTEKKEVEIFVQGALAYRRRMQVLIKA